MRFATRSWSAGPGRAIERADLKSPERTFRIHGAAVGHTFGKFATCRIVIRSSDRISGETDTIGWNLFPPQENTCRSRSSSSSPAATSNAGAVGTHASSSQLSQWPIND
jgi:hypothetical protein